MTFLYAMLALAAYILLALFLARFVGFNDLDDDE